MNDCTPTHSSRNHWIFCYGGPLDGHSFVAVCPSVCERFPDYQWQTAAGRFAVYTSQYEKAIETPAEIADEYPPYVLTYMHFAHYIT